MLNRIMVVEDEYIVSLDLKTMLEDLGHQVIATVTRGEEVVNMAYRYQPDMVLMDIRLAGKTTGTEAAQRLREVMDVPVIFLSAYSDDSVLAEAEKSFPYGYLLKPFERRELAATIRMATVKHRSELNCRLSELRLRMAIKAAHLSYFELNCVTDHLQFYGFHQTWLEPHHPAGTSALLTLIESSQRDQLQQQLKSAQALRVLSEAGDQLPGGYIEIHAEKMLFGAQQSWIGVVEDVTERQSSEVKLRQAKAVFDTTTEAILILNENGEVSSANPAFSRVTGYRIQQIIGRTPENFLYDVAGSLNPPKFQDMSATHWSGEVSCIKNDGLSFPAWLHICKVRSPFTKKNIDHYVLMFSDISALRRAEEHLVSLVHHDHLTGLGNRRKLEKVLHTEIIRSQRHRSNFGVLYLDLDGFKLVNDTLGHAIGDRLLQTVATRITSYIRIGDTATRVGGDEFVIVLSDVQAPSDCFVVAEKILKGISQDIVLNDNIVSISGSMGIALYPNDAGNGEDLLKCADLAMFNAKDEGKNRYAFFNQSLSDKAHQRVALERELRSALQHDSQAIQLYYQPIYEAGSLRVCGVEALLRWHHSDLGLVPTDRFIHVAEQSNLICDLGDLVCRRLLSDAPALFHALDADCYIALNLSVKQFDDKQLLERLQKFFTSSNLWSFLQFEVTETALLHSNKLEPTLEALQAMGATIALDDFGTGYSSLSRLKDLPLNCLKIDRSFISSILSDTKSLEIVKAVCTLGKALDLKLVAEGVETSEQLKVLQEIGCDLIQGYLLARPMPLTELIQHLNLRSYQS